MTEVTVFQTRAEKMRRWRRRGAASWTVLLAVAAVLVAPTAVRAQEEEEQLGGPGMDDLRNEVGQTRESQNSTSSTSSQAEIVLVNSCHEDQFSERRSSRMAELCIAEQS